LEEKRKTMAKDYVHPVLNEEVTAISGHYTTEKEERMTIDGHEVLYILGHAVVDTSCCGVGGGRFAVVPGYLVRYKYRTDDTGRPVSEVTPVEDERETRKVIAAAIEKKEPYCSVRFLS
jgi:hypothetical protein